MSPDALPPPSPVLLKQIIFRMVADGELSAQQAGIFLQNIKNATPSFSLTSTRDHETNGASHGTAPIAVVGMAGRFGAAGNLDEFWRLIADGADCLAPPPPGRWPGQEPALRGGFLPDAEAFDPLFFHISPTEAALIDPQQRVFLEQAYLALEHAGYTAASLSGARCGVFVGAGAGDYAHRFAGTAEAANPQGLLGNVASVLAARISYFLNLKGPSIALDTACSSSLVAVHLACEGLCAGSIDMALAGGVAVVSTPLFVAAMRGSGAISARSQCRSFDAEADGFVCGEGAGAVVLKRLADALADGDPIHGLIRGSGVNQDGRSNGITAPSAPAQAALVAEVYQRAGIDPASIGYVEAHGTGTVLGDPIEVEGLTQAFRQWTDATGICALGSVKANIGHALTAAGIAGLLKLLLMLRHRRIPPQPHFERPNPRIGFERTPFFVPRANSLWPAGETPRRGAVSSFGFSGTNAHVLVEAPPPPPQRRAAAQRPRTFVLSARTEQALATQAALLAHALTSTEGLRADDVAHTLATGRTALPARLAVVAETLPALAAHLSAYVAGQPGPALRHGIAPAALAGATPNDPDEAARFFVAGGTLAASEPLARRVPLPSCPFDRASYGVPAPGIGQPTGLHDAVARVQAAADPALGARGAGFAAVEAWGRRALHAAYAALGLGAAERHVYTRAGLRRALRITSERARLHEALLDMLARAGALRCDDDLVRIAAEPPTHATLAAERAALQAADPALAPFFALLARCAEHLPALLTGRMTAPEILFPDGSMALVEAVYRGNMLADHFNALLAAAVSASVRAAGRPVRLLELGAGTGGATTGILAALDAAGLAGAAHYRITDVSPGFVQAAQARFGMREGVSFGVLDLERDPAEPAQYDVVVASNVLHATRDIAATLRRVHRLTAPGGTLVLNEVTALQDFATLTFGLTDGWWAFADAAARLPGAPLLDVARWRHALAAAGFPTASAFGLPGQREDDAMGQAIIVAQRDAVLAVAPASAAPEPSLSTPPPAAAAGGLVDGVLAEVAAALNLPAAQVDRHGRFMEYGIDSILGVKVVARLNARFGLDLRPTVLFDHPTAATLARHLESAHGLRATVTAPAAPEADRRIAIVGMAGRFGSTANLDEFRALLAEGRSGITEVPATRWSPADASLPEAVAREAAYLRWGGFLRDADRFDPLFFRISGREAELTDPQHRVFLTEAWRALEHAGYGEQALDGQRCGVFVGAHGGDYTHRMTQFGIVPEAFAFMGNAASILAGRIAYILNLKGPCLAVDTACSSSLVAVHLACRSLLDGECDMALAGGVFLTTTLGFNTAAAKAGMLSPTGQCHTFDAAADGFVPGEGAGVVVLKRYAEAVADGDHIEAVILGSAVNQDGRTNGITAPSPEAQAAVAAAAYASAGIDPARISCIEAHGTGTPLGDPIEIEGLTRAFARSADPGAAGRRGWCAIGSVKTNIGHAAHAAGIAGLLKVVLSLRDRQLYPSRNFSRENPMLRLSETPFAVNTTRRAWESDGPRVAGVSSFGFSGTNAHIVLQEAPEPPPRAAMPGPFLVPLSAKSPEALRRMLSDLAGWLAAHPDAALADVSRTLAVGRGQFPVRFAAVVADAAGLAQALASGAPGQFVRLAGDAADPARLHHLAAIAERFVAGAEIDLCDLAAEGRRIALPGYPFEEQSYWIGTATAAVVSAARPDTAQAATYLAPVWQAAPPIAAALPTGPVWIAGGDAGLITALVRAGVPAAEMPNGAATTAPAACVLVHGADASVTEVLQPLVAALQALPPGPCRVLVVGPAGEAARPLGRSLAFTGGQIVLRVVDPGEADIAACIAAELPVTGEGQVRWQGGARQQRWMAPVAAPAAPATLRAGGTVLITGGGGALAELFGRDILRRTGGRLALLGRRPLDPAMQARLTAHAAEGGEAAYFSADVTDAASLNRAVAEVRARFGAIHGVIHAAGVPGEAVFAGKPWGEFARVLAPKLAARTLDAALAEERLDFFALFSSLAAELGDFGQGDYAVGNATLGAFAAERERLRRRGARHGVTVALAWPLWRAGRKVLSAEGEAVFLRTAGLAPLEAATGVRAFLDALALGHSTLAVVPGTPAVAERLFPTPAAPAAPNAADLAGIQARVTRAVSDLLKIPPGRLGPDTGFAEFGFDSIALKEFAALLADSFGVAVTPAVFFAHGTIAALSRHLLAEHPGLARGEPLAAPPPVAAPSSAGAAVDGAVAIIGMAGRFPGSPDLATFWQHLEAGDDLIGPLPPARLAWQPDRPPPPDVVLRGGFLDDVENFDAGFFRIAPREAVHMDPQHRLALQVVWHCVEDAGLRTRDLAGRPVGVFFGQQVNDYAALLPSREDARAQVTLGNIAAMLPNRISFQFDLRGPSEAIDTACSSALVAVHRAARAVAGGECELAIAGGVSLMLSVDNLVSTQRLGILSPDGVCRSFDAAANGYVKGEGVGAVLLKPLARALADGDVIHAVIRGSAENHGGRAHSLTAPNAVAQTEVIVAALARAGVGSDTIGYVEAHGTGTELGDPVEVMALKDAFAHTAGGEVARPRCRIGSVKPSVGHLEPASGIAGLLKVVLALQQQMIPATRNFRTLNPHIALNGSPFEIASRLTAWAPLEGHNGAVLPRRAGVSSFGFGGSNAHVVLEEAPARPTAPAADAPLLLVVSAATRTALAASVGALLGHLRSLPAVDAAALAATLMLGREALSVRLAVLLRPGEAAAERLARALDALDAPALRDGIWLGEAVSPVTPDAEEAAFHAAQWRRGQHGRLAALWVQGTDIAWAALLGPGQRRMPLPGTRFAATRCWFDSLPAAAVTPTPAAPGPTAPPVAPAADRTAIRDRLRSMVAQALYVVPEAIDCDAGFGDLGLDSILAVELTREINAAFGTSLQATRLYDHATIAALAAHLAHAAPATAPAAPLPPAAPVAAGSGGVLEQLRNMLAAALYLEPAAIDDHAGFGDLGLDSILAVEFTKSINDTFGAGLTATRLYDHADLASLAAHVAAHRATAPLPAPVSARAAEALSFLAGRLAAATGRPRETFTATTALADIALEPAQAIALLAELNAAFGTDLAPDDVGRCRDLSALAALFDQAPPAAAPEPAPPLAHATVAATTPAPVLAPDVAIIGLACRFPGAPDLAGYWDLLRSGRDAVTDLPAEPWRAALYRAMLAEAGSTATPWGGYIAEVDRFDPLFFNLSPKDAALMDPQQRLFLEVAWHALEDAGQTPAMLNGAACGIFVGVGQGDYSQLVPRDPAQVSGQMLLGNTASILTARLAYWLNLKGPSLAVDTACSSSQVAAHLAWQSIRDGECDMALAGGVNLMLTPQMHLMTGASGMLSADGRCKTFDDAADGFVPGEGVGVIVLKRLDRALADGDRVYAVIAGSAVNQDGKTSSITAPSAASQAALEARLYDRFAIPLDNIGLVEAHGTGTKLGDPIEIAALTEAFARRTARRQDCAIGSVKTNIGHTLAAAGVAGLIKLALAMRARMLPPSLHFTHPNGHIDFAASPFVVNTALRPWPAPARGKRLAAISSFGFSGTNAHMVLAEPPAPAPIGAVEPWQLVLLSARSPAALARQREALARYLDDAPQTQLADLAYTLGRRRAVFTHRAAFVVADITGLRAALAGATERAAAAPAALRDAAAVFAAGGAIDVANLFPTGAVVSLPGYPFERTRHWVEGAAPLVQHHRIAATDAVVAQHLVGGRPLLPAAATLGLLHGTMPPRDPDGPGLLLRNVAWRAPVAAPATLAVALAARGDAWAATVTDDAGRLCITAEIDTATAPPPHLDLLALRRACAQPVPPAALDALFAAGGIAYGPAYRCIEAIWTGRDAVLARIAVPSGDTPFPAPALDAGLRVAAALLLGAGATAAPQPALMLPAGAAAIHAWRPLTGPIWSHVRANGPSVTDDGFTCDITLCDDDGRPLVAVTGFNARAAAPAPSPAAQLFHLRPRWRLDPLAVSPCHDQALVLHGGGEAAWAEAYAANRGDGCVRLLSVATALPAIRSAAADAEEIVVCAWHGDPAERLRLLLAVLQSLDETPRALKLVTRGVQSVAATDRTAAELAALLGLAGTAAHELPWLRVSVVDLPAQESADEQAAHCRLLESEPGGAEAELAYRGGRRYRRALETFVPPPAAGLRLERHAACLIIGGAGGLGVATSRWLASRFGARIAWVGRRGADAAITAAIEEVSALGGTARYLQADAADPVALTDAIAAIEADWGPLALVIHAALVLRDRSLSRMTAEDLDAALRPKQQTALTLATALAGRTPELVVFSSMNSFTLNRGQANYAAGCTFIDAWARAYAEQRGAPVRVINWGFWGEVGAVATPAHRARALREGVAPLATDDALAALDRALGSPVPQAAIVNLAEPAAAAAAARFAVPHELAETVTEAAATAAVLAEAAGIAAAPPEATAAAEAALAPLLGYARGRLHATLSAAGLLDPAAPAVVPAAVPLHRAALGILARAETLSEPVPRPTGPALAAMLALLDTALDGIAGVLTGRSRGVDVLFPNGDTALVEAVYRDNPLVDRFNGQLTRLAAAMVGRTSPLRVLEIGAGTGGASAGILAALAGADIDYVYTDISPTLLDQAQARFGHSGFVSFRRLDITVDPRDQGLPAGAFDLVVASNVLHATPEIATTLRHAKLLLARGGVLLLNEITAASDFATLTFGLTPDWWAFRDPERRLPQTPALDVAGWCALLAEEGFRHAQPVGVGADERPGQCVLLAVSDGWLPAPSARPATPPPPRAAVTTLPLGDVTAYVAGVFGEVLKLPTDSLGPLVPYAEYGVDSLVTQELRARLERDLGKIPATLLLEHATIADLAQALAAPFAAWTAQHTPAQAAPQPLALSRPAAASAPIAIVGMAGRFPGAPDLATLWRRLRAGESAITEVPATRWDLQAHWDPLGSDPARAVGKWGGFLDDVDCFDPLFFGIPPAEAALIDPQERLFLQTVWATLEDAGITRARLRAATGGRVGVFVGASSTDWLRLSAEAWHGGNPAAGGAAFWSMANRTSFFFDCHGPSLVVDTACSAALTALHLACESIRRGECAAAIAGGVNLILHPRSQIGLSQLGLMSPSGACRAFDAAADGLVEGEGVAAVLLRPLAEAQRDGDRIRGVIVGSAIGASGRTSGYLLPSPQPQAELIRAALDDAGTTASGIGYVEAQAVGSRLADPVEAEGLARVFGRAGRAVRVGSVKPNLGHLAAASGMAQLAKVLLQFEHDTLLPTIGIARLNPEIDFAAAGLQVQQVAEPWPSELPRRAAISAFGAGGANAHVIVEAAQPRRSGAAPSGRFLFPLSARSPERLRATAGALRAALAGATLPLDRVAWTLQLGREAMAVRLILAATDQASLLAQLDAFLAGAPVAEPTDAVARAFLAGAPAEFAALWPVPPLPIALPSYPFEPRRCWLPAAPAAAVALPSCRFAVLVEGPGTPDDIVLRELPVVPPGPGEVLIETHAFALNFADVLCLSGLYPNLPPYPFIPGMELSGRVLALGAGVSGLAVGDRVVALTPHGAHASIVTAPAAAVMAIPAELDFVPAAAAPVALLTAEHAFARAALQAGETVLVQSAAGGVGLAAVRMALHRGARVIGVVGSAAKAAHLRGLGLAGVIDRSAEDTSAQVRALTGGRGVDVVLNTRGGADIQLGIDLLAPGGRYVEMALAGLRAAGPLDLSRLMDNQSLITLNLGRVIADPQAVRRAMRDAMQTAADPALRPTVGRVVSLAEVAEAYRWLASGESVGKVVVQVDPQAQVAVVARPPTVAPAPAAASQVTERLAEIVAACLGLAGTEIDLERPLGEYGLTSALAVGVMRRVQEAFGLALPVALLWEQPSVTRLAAAIVARLGTAAAGVAATGPIVRIQSGGRRAPSVWVHGAPGEISWVVALARLLGPDFPVCGIEARGVRGDAPPRDSIPEMASAYVDALLRDQPTGPYWLGGYSAGGPIAFAMASELSARGRDVARLVLLDAPAPGTQALRGMTAAADGLSLRLAANWFSTYWQIAPGLDATALDGLPPDAARARVIAHLHDPAIPGRSQAEIGRMLDAIERVGQATGRALSAYAPKPLLTDMEVVLFACRGGMGRYAPTVGDYRHGWAALLARPPRRIWVECDHFDLLTGRFGAEVAAALAALPDPAVARRHDLAAQ